MPGHPQEIARDQARAGSLNPLGELSGCWLVGGAWRKTPPLRSGGSARGTPVSEELFFNVGLVRSRVGAGAMDELPFGETALEQTLAEMCELDTAVLNDIEGACLGAPARPVQGRTSGEGAWPGTSARAHCAIWHLVSRVEFSGRQWARFLDTLSIH